MSGNAAVTGRASRCPDCGLTLHVSASATGPELGYDFATWNRLCRHPALGSPSMCLAQAADRIAGAVDPTPRSLDDPAEDRVFGKAPF
jgi:hypothetical protein